MRFSSLFEPLFYYSGHSEPAKIKYAISKKSKSDSKSASAKEEKWKFQDYDSQEIACEQP